ncbi:MAG TPA: glycosyltransferase [Armatimonadota bacterium]|jgi:glycosyltransferase involved in cell wall biosynthesis
MTPGPELLEVGETPAVEVRAPAALVYAPLRIAHVVSSLELGGMEQFVLRLAWHQQEQGHRVSVLGLRGGPLLEDARAMGLDAVALPPCGKPQRILRAAGFLLRRRPQIVNAHNSFAVAYGLLGKLAPGTRVVMIRHGQEEINPLPSEAKLRRTDAIVAVSEAAGAAMRAKRPGCAGKLRVVHNGVDPAPPRKSRTEVREELGLTDEVVALQVARVDALKGHDTLLRSLGELASRGVRLVALVVGDGPERARLSALAQELGLGERQVRFLGFRSDVPDLLAASDLFVLPSLTEGLPLSVLEAMAQGLPVVASAVGGVPELIEDQREGLLVPPKDPRALAQALEALVTDRELRRRMGRAGEERVAASFTFDEMARRYDELYYELRASGVGDTQA